MRVRLNRFRFPFILASLAIGAGPAHATSIGKAAAPSASACAVSARFVDAKSDRGKLFWRFERIASAEARGCGALARTFAVWIPSGSYSALSRTNVYPLSITEPKPGEEIDLRIEAVRLKSGESRWLIAGDADAFRVRR